VGRSVGRRVGFGCGNVVVDEVGSTGLRGCALVGICVGLKAGSSVGDDVVIVVGST